MSTANYSAIGILGFIAVSSLIAFGMWGCPQYTVYEQGLIGKAALERADQDRQIRVREAQAELEAAKLLNQAEVERAKGLAEATGIAVKEFGGPEAYLRYLWIEKVANSSNQLIYVPTEAGMPILEATRLGEGR